MSWRKRPEAEGGMCLTMGRVDVTSNRRHDSLSLGGDVAQEAAVGGSRIASLLKRDLRWEP